MAGQPARERHRRALADKSASERQTMVDVATSLNLENRHLAHCKPKSFSFLRALHGYADLIPCPGPLT
ncbi:hypothetical protein V7x_39020 [Crateriforma conspicua]|uniref:Uncharacterized protein n=1 Tax=Crateriforma conspicua TaxID=2527996 RepID=A0A5C6FP62_9PLAN|nr:hypothetical protein V7x_39020 [Crateriforma conspicua]